MNSLKKFVNCISNKHSTIACVKLSCYISSKQFDVFPQVTGLLQLRLTLTDKLKENVAHLATLQSRVLDEELIRWKREQQLAGNGAKFVSNLDIIQEWFVYKRTQKFLQIIFIFMVRD